MEQVIVAKLGLEGGGATICGRVVEGVWSFWQEGSSMDFDENDDEVWKSWHSEAVTDLVKALPDIWPLMSPIRVHPDFLAWFNQRYEAARVALPPAERRMQERYAHRRWQSVLAGREADAFSDADDVKPDRVIWFSRPSLVSSARTTAVPSLTLGWVVARVPYADPVWVRPCHDRVPTTGSAYGTRATTQPTGGFVLACDLSGRPRRPSLRVDPLLTPTKLARRHIRFVPPIAVYYRRRGRSRGGGTERVQTWRSAEMMEPPRTTAMRYGLALGALGLATLVRVGLDPLVGDTLPFVTYYLAAAITALMLGMGPSLLILGCTALLAPYLFITPRYSVGIANQRSWVSLGFFLLVGLVNTLLSDALRKTRRVALDGQAELKRQIAERIRAEGELRDREIWFRALVENSSDILALLKPDGHIIYISPAIRRITGFDPEQMIGDHRIGIEQVHPDDRDAAARVWNQIQTSPGEAQTFQLRIRHQDGSWRWVENVATNLLGVPSIAAIVVNARDVTERTVMEERIRDGEARFRAFMENSPALGYLKDEEGRYVWGNRVWRDQFDRPHEELWGLDDFALWPDPVARQFRDSDRRALEAGQAVESVETVGDRHYMSLKFPLEYSGGRFLGGMTLDVTDRVRAQEALRRSETLLLALADSMPQMVWAARPDGHLDYYNRRCFDFTGLTEAELLSPEGWLPIVHPDDATRSQETWYRSVASGQPYEIEYRFKDRRSDGYRWFLGRALPVRDESGEIVRWYGTSTDIDDQKRAEQSAEAASLAKDRFIAVLSHELRTPLTPVLLGVSSLLNDPTLPAEIRATMEMIRRNITLESRLIDDLLHLTKISRGSFSMRKETASAHDLLNRALEICREDLDDAGLTLTIDLSASQATVSADIARLQQAFWNLIKNAVKFTPCGGSITIRSRNEPAADPEAPTLLIVEVSDTGVGIDPAFLPRMFEAFEQGEATSWTRRFGGLGLGLSITRSIVEGHSGTLSAHSPGLNLGATLRISLPTIPAPAASPMSPAAPLANPTTSKSSHILLIEDDPTTLTVLASLLRQIGYLVTTANSVSSALAAADSHDNAFDLIISDIGLPDGNGVDLMRTLQTRRPFPAIALSGYGMDEDIAKSLAAGFRSHLTKPINFGALETAIAAIVSRPT